MAGQFCNGKITHCFFQFDYGLNAYWRRSRRGYHASAEGVMGIIVYVIWTQLWVHNHMDMYSFWHEVPIGYTNVAYI